MINHEFTSGAGLGFTEFCINIPWAGFSVLLANLLAEHASWRWPYYIAIIYSVVCLDGQGSKPILDQPRRGSHGEGGFGEREGQWYRYS